MAEEKKPSIIAPKVGCKRSINEELIDVWAELMGEKIEKIREKQEMCEDQVQYLRLESYISGISESMAMLSCLEQGRFQKDYDRVLRKFKA